MSSVSRTTPAGPRADASRRRARVSVSAAYAVQGMAFAVMLTNVPTYQDRLGMDDAIITLVVLGVCVCAGAGSALSGLLANRHGSARVVAAGLVGVALTVLAVGLATTWPTFFVAFGAYGLCLGAVDASISMQGVALERSSGRPVLASLFAANAAGGVLGALLVSGAALADRPLTQSLPLVAVLVMSATQVLRPGLLRTDAGGLGASVEAVASVAATAPGATALGPTTPRPAEHGTAVPTPVVPDPALPTPVLPGAAVRVAVPAGTVVVLGVAMLAFPVADSSASTWGAPFLRDVVGASAVVAPLGYGAYQATLIASRLFADSWVARAGRVRVVRLGGTVGALGLLAVALAPAWPVALLGFAATGLGLGVVAPLAFSAAGDRATEAVARAHRAPAVSPGRAGPSPASPGPGVPSLASPDLVKHARTAPGPVTPAGPVTLTVTPVEAVADRAVARLNIFTYVGAVLGGALTGVFATADALRTGFVVLAALALVSAVLAARFREAAATPPPVPTPPTQPAG